MTETLYKFALYVGCVGSKALTIPIQLKLVIYMISKLLKLCYYPLTKYKVTKGKE